MCFLSVDAQNIMNQLHITINSLFTLKIHYFKHKYSHALGHQIYRLHY